MGKINIFFDEAGNFENDVKGLKFIAGLIYDDCDKENGFFNEKARINQFYLQVISQAKENYLSSLKKDEKNLEELFVFPEALHVSKDRNVKDSKLVVSYVKEEVNKALPEFIKDGTFNGEKIKINGKSSVRKGKYHLFVYLKGENDIKFMKSAPDFINEEFASNLYYHMVSRTIDRILINNPIYQNVPTVCFTAPTRSINPDLDSDYKKLGYSQNGRFVGGNGFFLTNNDVYRTLIAQSMIYNRDKNIDIEYFKVFDIKYKLTTENGKSSVNEGLYMADSICSYLSWFMKGNSGSKIKKIDSIASKINPENDNLVFAYDSIDFLFDDVLKAYKNDDLYETLSKTYDIRQLNDDCAKFYDKKWLSLIESRIRDKKDMVMLEKGLDNLDASIRMNNLNQDKLDYIFGFISGMLEKGISGKQNGYLYEKCLFKLYSVGITAKCHIGDPSAALHYYNLCTGMMQYAGIDQIVSMRNRICVALEDLFAWRQAEEIAKENMELVTEYSDLMNKYSDTKVGFNINKGKAISQYARTLAEKRDKKAEEMFREALRFFDPSSPDYKITQSYLLHFYLDNGMYNKYEDEATMYFAGNVSYQERLKYVYNLDEKRTAVISKKFAFYVLFRGLYYTQGKNVSDEIYSVIKEYKFSADNDVDGVNTYTEGHPWEIIYKYLELIAESKADKEMIQYFADQRKKCMRSSGETINALMLFGDAELASIRGLDKERQIITGQLCNYLMKHFKNFEEYDFADNNDERYKQLSDIFTFMYR